MYSLTLIMLKPKNRIKMDLSCFPRGIQLTDTFSRLSSHWASARNRFPNVFAAISKIIPAHEIFLRRSDPVAIILKAELAFVSRQILFGAPGWNCGPRLIRFSERRGSPQSNQLFPTFIKSDKIQLYGLRCPRLQETP